MKPYSSMVDVQKERDSKDAYFLRETFGDELIITVYIEAVMIFPAKYMHLFSKSRDEALLNYRMIFIWAATFCGVTTVALARFLHLDHTTISYYIHHRPPGKGTMLIADTICASVLRRALEAQPQEITHAMP